MKTKYKIAVFGIVVIASLETLALLNGIDGVALSASIGGVGAIVGYIVKDPTGILVKKGRKTKTRVAVRSRR